MSRTNAFALGDISGPAALVDNFKKTAGNFNPATARKEFTDNEPLWQQYLDLMELDANKIKGMLDKHGGEGVEDQGKYELRQNMAVVFNLVPSIINMIVGYMFAEEPILDANEDPDLVDFLENCDGKGLPFKEWMRLQALPMSLIFGQIDTLVQNPLGADLFTDAAAAKEAGIVPTVFAITPLQRLNWSCKPSGEYNWICFKDLAGDDPNPFVRDDAERVAYITISAAYADISPDTGFWIRSTLDASPAVSDTVAGTAPAPGKWNHLVGTGPTERCGVATLYYRQSLDPMKRHAGVSKIAMIAILTRAILNVLSWTQEDMLSNLALLALPSPGGRRPTDDDGNPITPTLSPSTILWYDPKESGQPKVIQGEVSHIKIKLEFVAALVQEILRVANLMGVSADATATRSGIQGLVERNELFQELAQISGGLDTFAYEVLALAKSWSTGDDWTAEMIRERLGVKVNHHKGPYTLDPLKDVITNARHVLGMFATVSPTMATAAMKYVARSFLYNNDPDLEKVIQEIQEHGGNALALMVEKADLALETASAAIVPEAGDLGLEPAAPPATTPGTNPPGNAPAGA